MALWTPGLKLTDKEIEQRNKKKTKIRTINGFVLKDRVDRSYDTQSYEALQKLSSKSKIRR